MFISSVAIRRPVLTSMGILALVVFGWVSLRGLSLDLFPKVDFPIVTIKTVFEYQEASEHQHGRRVGGGDRV